MSGIPINRERPDMSPAENAAEWLIRRETMQQSLSDEDAFADWLKETPHNLDLYRQASETWRLFDAVQADRGIEALRAAALDDGPSGKRLWWIGMAASVLIALVGGAWLASPRWIPTTVATSAGGRHALTYRTARGQRLNVHLPDGTAVALNTDSMLTIAYNKTQRRVNLVKGQAFFEVAKNKAWPFVVAGGGQEVTALGTAFDVHVGERSTRTLLVEGKVWIQPTKSTSPKVEKSYVLTPGEMLTRQASGDVLEHVDMQPEMLWRRGLVEFDDRPLGEAVEEMNRYASQPLLIRDRQIAALKVSGIFKTGRVDRFVATISEILPVQGENTSSGIEIVHKSNPAGSR